MKPAHVYLFTSKSRRWWWARICTAPNPNNPCNIRDVAFFPSAASIKLDTEHFLRLYGMTATYQPTRSVPHPEAE